jgi:hypothetical protein
MSLSDLETIFKKTKVSILNPQTATYAGIGITTLILAYYTLYESGSTKSTSAEKAEEPKVEEPKEEEPKEEEPKEEEPKVEEPKEEINPAPEENEGSLNPLAGGKTKKHKKTKSNRKLKKVKKNKTR